MLIWNFFSGCRNHDVQKLSFSHFEIFIHDKIIILWFHVYCDIERRLKERTKIASPRRSRVDAIFVRFFNRRSMTLYLFGGFRVDLDPYFGGLKSARNPQNFIMKIMLTKIFANMDEFRLHTKELIKSRFDCIIFESPILI